MRVFLLKLLLRRFRTPQTEITSHEYITIIAKSTTF